MNQALANAYYETAILTLRDSPSNTKLTSTTEFGTYLGNVREFFSEFAIAISLYDKDDKTDKYYWLKPITGIIINRIDKNGMNLRASTISPISTASEYDIVDRAEVIIFGHTLSNSRLSGLYTWNTPARRVLKGAQYSYRYYTCDRIPQLSDEELENVLFGECQTKPIAPQLVLPNISQPVDMRAYSSRDVTDYVEGLNTFVTQFDTSISTAIDIPIVQIDVNVLGDILEKVVPYNLIDNIDDNNFISATLPTTLRPTSHSMINEIYCASSFHTIFSILNHYKSIWEQGKLVESYRIENLESSSIIHTRFCQILLGDPGRVCERARRIYHMGNAAAISLIDRNMDGTLINPMSGVLMQTYVYDGNFKNISFETALFNGLIEYDNGDHTIMAALLSNLILYNKYAMEDQNVFELRLSLYRSKTGMKEQLNNLACLLISVCIDWN